MTELIENWLLVMFISAFVIVVYGSCKYTWNLCTGKPIGDRCSFYWMFGIVWLEISGMLLMLNQHFYVHYKFHNLIFFAVLFAMMVPGIFVIINESWRIAYYISEFISKNAERP